MCESPLCVAEQDAIKLQALATQKNCILAVSYPYAYFGILRYARDLIEKNCIGNIINIRVNYLQSTGVFGHNQAVWMNMVQDSGSYCFADLGLQAIQLVRHITQLTPHQLSACLSRSYQAHTLDDNGSAVVNMKEGAVCHMNVSKMSFLHDNDLEVEVDGTSGSLHWDLGHSNQLIFLRDRAIKQVLTANSLLLDGYISRYSRTPPGCSEVRNDDGSDGDQK